MRMYIIAFFFFQAEDGIRDHCVTGVQTCALPISVCSVSFKAASDPIELVLRGFCSRLLICSSSSSKKTSFPTNLLALSIRSEERRVGKECRYRWSPDM